MRNIGLLKMDFLGLRNLTVIGDAIDNIKTNRGEDIDLDRLGVDDSETYKMLGRGDTLGVFQLDGGSMRICCAACSRWSPTSWRWGRCTAPARWA